MEQLIPIIGALFVFANVVFGLMLLIHKLEHRDKKL